MKSHEGLLVDCVTVRLSLHRRLPSFKSIYFIYRKTYSPSSNRKLPPEMRFRAIPHKWVGAEANDFFVRCNCRFWRFTGGQSKNLQAANGEKGIACAANELCGIALGKKGSACHKKKEPADNTAVVYWVYAFFLLLHFCLFLSSLVWGLSFYL